MNLDQLQVFLAVARHLHFSRAADDLHMTQPAVSATVARLEAHCGIKLFHRIGRRVALTDAGRFLRDEAPELLDRVDRLERGLQDFIGLRRGLLSLGACSTVGHCWLPPRIRRFGALHPEIELRCSLGTAEQVMEGTARGRFDLCFLTGWAGQPTPADLEAHLSASEVGQERLLVVVSRRHPWYGIPFLAATELVGTPWVVRERGSGAQRLFELWLRQAGVEPEAIQARLVLSSSEMVKALVLEGAGAAALPESMVRMELAQGLLWEVAIEPGFGASQPIWMIRHDQRYPSPALRAFEAVIRAGGVAADAHGSPGEEQP